MVIKILAVNREKSGSDWHRIFYNLNKINGLEIEDAKIEVTFTDNSDLINKMSDYDILAYNWDCELKVQELAELQKRSKKVLYFIDDFWEFPERHYNYMNSLKISARTKQHLLQADAVVCTTQDLMLKAIHYSDNVAVIPNFLNPNDFNIKEKSTSDKLRIGLVGSSSHIPNFLDLKGAINRIAKNKELCKKIEFVIAGYVNNPSWNLVIDMFKKKKNISYKVLDYIPLKNYLDVYSEIDVCLMPLELHNFNFCRSSLKLVECALTNTIPVGSPIYTQKEVNKLISCFQPLDYEETIEILTNKEYFDKILKDITTENLSKNDYQLRFDNMLKVVNTVYRENNSVDFARSMSLHTVIYDENQIPLFTEYDNKGIKDKAWRFEYNPIIDIVSKPISELYVGVFSPKFEEKTNFTKNILIKYLNKNEYWEYDIINLSKRYWKSTEDYLKFSYKQHPKLEYLLKKVLNKLGKNYVYNENYVYSNFFMLKTDLYKDYVNNWIIPALDYMENEIWEEVNVDANYKGNSKLKELTGLDYYNYVTFVLERLILFYIAHNKLKCLNA